MPLTVPLSLRPTAPPNVRLPLRAPRPVRSVMAVTVLFSTLP